DYYLERHYLNPVTKALSLLHIATDDVFKPARELVKQQRRPMKQLQQVRKYAGANGSDIELLLTGRKSAAMLLQQERNTRNKRPLPDHDSSGSDANGS